MNSKPAGNGKPIDSVSVDATPDSEQLTPPPCFYWKVCATRAVVNKVGRSVCRGCAARLHGPEYPLRPPSRPPRYLSGPIAAELLDMTE